MFVHDSILLLVAVNDSQAVLPEELELLARVSDPLPYGVLYADRTTSKEFLQSGFLTHTNPRFFASRYTCFLYPLVDGITSSNCPKIR